MYSSQTLNLLVLKEERLELIKALSEQDTISISVVLQSGISGETECRVTFFPIVTDGTISQSHTYLKFPNIKGEL